MCIRPDLKTQGLPETQQRHTADDVEVSTKKPRRIQGEQVTEARITAAFVTGWLKDKNSTFSLSLSSPPLSPSLPLL